MAESICNDMEKTDKSAEDFFKAEADKQWINRASFSSDPGSISRIPYVIYPAIYKVMNDYAAHQLSEYKEVIKELLPIAERMQQMCAYRGKGDSAYRDNGIEYKIIIDRAKKLIEK